MELQIAEISLNSFFVSLISQGQGKVEIETDGLHCLNSGKVHNRVIKPLFNIPVEVQTGYWKPSQTADTSGKSKILDPR